MWEHGTIPTYLGCTTLILIPKGNIHNEHIGILEVPWKVMESIIDTRIKKSMAIHCVLHGFFAGRGTRTSIMELATWTLVGY